MSSEDREKTESSTSEPSLFPAALEREKSDLHRLLRSRLSPGILVFSTREKLIYLNHEALQLLQVTAKPRSLSFKTFPPPMKRLYKQLKQQLQKAANNSAASFIKLSALLPPNLVLRGFGLQNHRQPFRQAQILFLIERIGQREKIDPAKLKTLSPREREIVGQIVQGRGNKEIAHDLCISLYTVEDHLKNIMRKMGVQSRTAIVAKLLNL